MDQVGRISQIYIIHVEILWILIQLPVIPSQISMDFLAVSCAKIQFKFTPMNERAISYILNFAQPCLKTDWCE